MSYSTTTTHTYTDADVEAVVRRFAADIGMIAQSSGAITEDRARDYAHDVEALAKKGYLAKVDLTLLSNNREVRATQFIVDTTSGELTMSRPGGVLWPRIANSEFRIVLTYTNTYDTAAREAMRSTLRRPWVPTTADTSHVTLKSTGNRDYASNAFGMRRQDFAA